VIQKHRILVEEGYPDDQAWAIAYDMVAKGEHAKPAHADDSRAHLEVIEDLVAKGMSEEQAAQVVKRRMKNVNEKPDGFVPPEAVAANAKLALKVRESKPESQQGMTKVGIARARDLSNRKSISMDTISRMSSFFERHEVDKQGETWDEQGKGWQAWNGWGGDEGWAWVKSILKEADDARDA
jgi:uncharacterized protein YoaH (UPF0181 family)